MKIWIDGVKENMVKNGVTEMSVDRGILKYTSYTNPITF